MWYPDNKSKKNNMILKNSENIFVSYLNWNIDF